MWGSKDSLWESVLSFHYVGLGDPTLVAKLGGKYLYPLSHLFSSVWFFVVDVLFFFFFLILRQSLKAQTGFTLVVYSRMTLNS